MATSKDWWARGLGIAGLVLGVASLGWQVFTYHDSLRERVLVRLSTQSELKGDESIDDAMKTGDLLAEIVNIGQHPLYLKSVSLAIEPEREFGPGEDPRYWDFGADKPKTVSALQPGAAAYYRLNKFDFAKHPLDSATDPSKKENYVVIVNSNAGEIFRSPVAITGYSFIHTLDPRSRGGNKN